MYIYIYFSLIKNSKIILFINKRILKLSLVHNDKKISKTHSFLSKPILCRRNKELVACAARRIPFYAVRIIKGCACVKKKSRRKRETKKERERDLKPTSTSYSSEGATTEIGI